MKHFYNNKDYRFLYLLKNNCIGAYKYGITRNFNNRLKWYVDQKYCKCTAEDWIYTKESDVEILRVYEGSNVYALEKELHKITKGAKKIIEDTGYVMNGWIRRYSEHYDIERNDVHNQVLIFFDNLNLKQ